MSGSEKNTTWLTMLGATLLASLFWGLLAQLDPLGAKSAANFHSESIFLRFIGGPWYQSKAQDAITVVLIDDNYLDETESSWPLPYLEQDLLLNEILDFEPRAVFLDLLYRHKHRDGKDDIKQLVASIARPPSDTGRSTTPVIIPYLVKDTEGTNTCSPGDTHSSDESIIQKNLVQEIKESKAVPTYIGWKGCGNRYPALVLGNKEYKTPAYALYELYEGCRLDPDDFLKPMMIRWGTGVSKNHKSALEKARIQCDSIDKDKWTSKMKYSLLQLSTALGQSLTSTSERGWSERCTYTDTVHATWFLGSSMENRDFLSDMLKDRIVLVGTQIDGVHDNIISPINGKLPGVYLFAMALDNYLEYGSRYYRPMPGAARTALEIGVLWFIAFSMGMLSPEGKLNHVFFTFFVYKLFLPVLISLLVASATWGVWRFAPMDWIGVSFLSFIANPITIRFYLKKKGRRYFPSVAGTTSIERGIWEDILSWLRFLLRRSLPFQMLMQLLKK